MELRLKIPFTKPSPDDLYRKINRHSEALKSIGMPGVIIEGTTPSQRFFTMASLFGGRSANVDCRTAAGQSEAYNRCPPLNAVVNRWLRASANARWHIVDSEGNDITPTGTTLPVIMQGPNAVQTWSEFVTQTAAMMLVHGQAYWYKLKPVGINNVSAMWVLPNYLVTEQVTGKTINQTAVSGVIDHYKVTIGGNTFRLSVDEVTKIRDISANFYAGTGSTNITDGQARIYAMSDVVNGLIAAYQAKKNTIVNRGPLGMLVSDQGNNVMTVPLSDEEERKLHDKLLMYGTQDGQRQEIISKHAMRWVQITKGIRELMLFEEIEAGTREVCAALDYPFELLGYDKGSSLAGGNKYVELKKMLYTDSIIPVMGLIGDALTREFLRPGQYIKPYYDHLDIYQSSRREDAEAMKIYNEACRVAFEGGAMTLEQWTAGLQNYL